jgi:hypothetical protein
MFMLWAQHQGKHAFGQTYFHALPVCGCFVPVSIHYSSSKKICMKKSISRSLAARFMIMAAVCLSLVSFSLPGGESFEIYVDKKLVLRHYVSVSKEPKAFHLDSRNPEGQVDIYYNHCGQLGKARSLTVKDAQDRVLKQWRFPGNEKFMSFKAKEVLALQKDIKDGRLTIYYSSEELPKGRMLATVSLAGDNTGRP